MWEKRSEVGNWEGSNTAIEGSDWSPSFQEARMGSFIDLDISLSVSVERHIRWQTAVFLSWPRDPEALCHHDSLSGSLCLLQCFPRCLLFAFHPFFCILSYSVVKNQGECGTFCCTIAFFNVEWYLEMEWRHEIWVKKTQMKRNRLRSEYVKKLSQFNLKLSWYLRNWLLPLSWIEVIWNSAGLYAGLINSLHFTCTSA